MTDLTDFAALAAQDHGLCVVTTVRTQGTVQASVVNAGVLKHPLRDVPVIGFVAIGGARKLANLRARAQTTIIARHGWNWIAAEGHAEIIGPDDPRDGVDTERLRLLLREIFTAAGGTHEDFDAYDAVMAEQRRAAVLVPPTRVYSGG